MEEWRPCDECGVAFRMRSARGRFCSPQCSHRIYKHYGARRARELGLPCEPIPRFALGERDGWRCYLCGGRTSGGHGDRHPLAPAVDHVRPFGDPESPGHVWSNVRTAHSRCNQRKWCKSLDGTAYFARTPQQWAPFDAAPADTDVSAREALTGLWSEHLDGFEPALAGMYE